MRRIRTVALSLCLFAALAAAAGDLPLIPVFRHGGIARSVGEANLPVADIDGDGNLDVLSCSNGAPFAVGFRDGAYVTIWQGPVVGCTSIATGDRNADGGIDVAVTTSSGFMVLDPRGLGSSTVVPVNGVPGDVAVGNVDADPAMEIVVVTLQAALVYDGVTLELQWTATGHGGASVQIGDVDGDSRAEVVVDSTNASVLDAQNEVLKWGFVGGFNGMWDLGNVDADAKEEIVFYEGSSVTILNGDTFAESSIAVVWIDALVVGDGNGDGAAEIVTGNNQWGQLRGYDPVSGAVVWYLQNPEHGASAVATGDFDGDGQPDVTWGAGLTHSGPDVLYIADVLSNEIEFETAERYGEYSIVSGDFDLDGRHEYVVTSRWPSNGFEMFDAATGRSLGQLTTGGTYTGDVQELAAGQLDEDPQLEILALVDDGVIKTWDGASRAPEFQSNGSLQGLAVVVANIDDDPIDEILVGGWGGNVVVLAGATNVIQKSLAVDGGVFDLAVADLNGAGPPELVVGNQNGVYVYDTTTWGVIGEQAITYGARKVSATAAGGGSVVAASDFDDTVLKVFHGSALTSGWSCTVSTLLDVAIGTVGGEARAFTVDTDGMVKGYLLDGADCPASPGRFAMENVNGIAVTDANGDGRNDLLLSGLYAAEVALVGLPEETRGDGNGDGVVTIDDIDAAAGYLFGMPAGGSPMADANADERISTDDLFRLIDHELGSGAALPEAALPSGQ